jgi:hypothetical protein
MRSHIKPIIALICLALCTGCILPSASAQSSDIPPPAQPLLAWTLSLDGTVLVIDAENRLYRLAVADLAQEARSEVLFDVASDDRLFLAAGYTQVFVGSESAGQTLVLDMYNFDPIATLDKAGPMAVDSNGKLFMISGTDIWAYNLMQPTQEPELAVPGPQQGLGSVPVGLWIHQPFQRLYVLFHDSSASPPHQREFFRVYSLGALVELGMSERALGALTRPAMVQISGAFLSTLYGKSPFYAANNLTIFDSKAQAIRSWEPLDGVPAISQEGLYVYLLRQRGLWVLSGKDMSVLSILFFTGPPPADVLLSPYGEKLYLLGNGWMEALSTAELPQLGIHPLSPFPLAWTDEATNHREHSQVPQFRIYPSPQMAQDGTTLAQVADYGETYRSTDGGRSWNLLLSLTYPNLQETPRLSLSPEFAADRTIVGHFSPIRRSTDGGESWVEWTPRIAFVSDRSGNREIYTMNQDGSDVRQLTFNPASDETPAWSPAWTRLAFQSDRGGNWDIFSTRAECEGTSTSGDECDLWQLTADLADDMLPAWSPDGRSIAFVSTRDGNPEIYVMDQDGGNPRRLTFNPTGDWRPTWMPDSKHILFTSDRGGNNDIYSIEVPPADALAPSAERDLQPIVTGPSDDRDPAMGDWGRLVFLSDRDGVMKAYRQDMKTPYASPQPINDNQEPEGHPTPIDDAGYAVLVTLNHSGATNIYRTGYVSEYEALTQGSSFDGHPAWGPVWWQPDVPSSLEWLRQ